MLTAKSRGMNAVQKIGEFWMPDVDVAPGANLEKTRKGFEGKAGIQIDHLERALSYFEARELAVDGGANVGAWARRMGASFGRVHSFEPNPNVFECLQRNVTDWGLAGRVTCYPKGLSDQVEYVSISTAEGARTVTGKVVGKGPIECVPIDSLDLEACSFIKLDLEGYEAKGLLGARRTIARFRPWVLIENKPRRHHKILGTPAVRVLKRMGYRLVEKIGADRIDWLFRPI